MSSYIFKFFKKQQREVLNGLKKPAKYMSTSTGGTADQNWRICQLWKFDHMDVPEYWDTLPHGHLFKYGK